MARRLSGGGAVFHDLGNLNFTFCVRRQDYNVPRQLSVIVEAVKRLGINAEISGRNDVTVDGRKISGNAFYRRGDFCYHHGTILVHVDKQQMSKYLNVSEQKLKSKGVESVKSRVANLNECVREPVTVAAVKKAMLSAFEACYGLSAQPFYIPEDAGELLSGDARHFASWAWKYGQNIPFTHEMSQRFDWGDVDMQLFVDGGIIQAAIIYSDAMEQEFIEALKNRFPGTVYDYRKMAELVHRCAVNYLNTGCEGWAECGGASARSECSEVPELSECGASSVQPEIAANNQMAADICRLIRGNFIG